MLSTMAPITHIISIILFIFLANGDKFVNDELEAIDTYELVHIDTNTFESTNTIQFIAFDQLYIIELIENRRIIPSAIKHSNGNPSISHGLDEYFTHLNATCHYFGKVLNSPQSSSVALSMCSKRGIRGSITAFGYTLIIKPSKYYLDIEYDRKHYHDITDEHLVYKVSRNGNTERTQRRRLLTDATNTVEMYILSDPIFTSYYISKYPLNWYDQLASYLVDCIHSVSAEYQNTDWGSAVGTIAVSLVELEVIQEYDGKYKLLTPIPYNAECTDVEQCTINGTAYLDDFTDYLVNYKNLSTFDTAQLWSKMAFEGMDGLSRSSSMCQSASSSIVSMRRVGDVGVINVSAHELGHVFGMSDDKDTECDTNEGIMGIRPNGFSVCSVQSLQNYFMKYRRIMTCLSDNVNPFITIPSCVNIKNMNDTVFNGDWKWDGSSYYLDTDSYYLYRLNGGYWVISDVKESESWYNVLAYCRNDMIIDCSGEWIKYIHDDGWYRDTAAYISECDFKIPTTAPTAPPEATASPETALECVRWPNMDINIDFSGDWNKIGSNTGHDMYRLNDLYLYFVSSNEWVISEVQGSENIYDILAYCHTSDDTPVNDCEGPWWILNTDQGTYDVDADAVFNECDLNCVALWNMEYGVFDGHWARYGVHDSRSAYSLNNLYLYYVSNWTEWVISRVFTGTDINVIWAYCNHSRIEECTADWFIWSGDFHHENTHSTVFDCAQEECEVYDCITDNYNGDWNPSGCYNSEAYYILSSSVDTRYICYNDKWIITDVLCNGQIYGYCESQDILDCNNAWNVDGKQIVMWQCSEEPPSQTEADTNTNTNTNTEPDECLHPSDYEDALCIYSNGTLWTGLGDFMTTNLCLNDKPIYYFEIEDGYEEYYYLHFNEEEWIISVNNLSTKGVALCRESDVLYCINWISQVEARSDAFGDMMVYGGGSCVDYLYIYDESYEPDEDNMGKKKKSNAGVIVAVVMSIGVVVAIVVVIYVKRKKKNENNTAVALKSGGSSWQDSAAPSIQVGRTIKPENVPDIIYDGNDSSESL